MIQLAEGTIHAWLLIDAVPVGGSSLGLRRLGAIALGMALWIPKPKTVKLVAGVSAAAVNDEKRGAVFLATLSLAQDWIDVDGKPARLAPGIPGHLLATWREHEN